MSKTNAIDAIDLRKKQLSYSSDMLLSSCPRKYELTKMNVADNNILDEKGELDRAFGHAVGSGIQMAFQGYERDKILWNLFTSWDTDFLNRNDPAKKSFFTAVLAIDKFLAMRAAGFLEGWELYYYTDSKTGELKPAVELSFLIDFNEGFNDRGFIDLVLVHSTTGQVLVVEVKTSGAYVINDVQYANSSQTYGYSIVLDHIKPGLNSYKVLYLVYGTRLIEYSEFMFNRSNLHKAEWIKNKLIKIEQIKMYERLQFWPKHGQSCNAYNKTCKFYGICGLSNSSLMKPITPKQVEDLNKENEERYHFKFKIADLIDTQLDQLGERK